MHELFPVAYLRILATEAIEIIISVYYFKFYIRSFALAHWYTLPAIIMESIHKFTTILYLRAEVLSPTRREHTEGRYKKGHSICLQHKILCNVHRRPSCWVLHYTNLKTDAMSTVLNNLNSKLK